MIDSERFIHGIDERGRWIAALARAFSRYSGRPAEHILDAMAVQARHYLMRWRETPPTAAASRRASARASQVNRTPKHGAPKGAATNTRFATPTGSSGAKPGWPASQPASKTTPQTKEKRTVSTRSDRQSLAHQQVTRLNRIAKRECHKHTTSHAEATSIVSAAAMLDTDIGVLQNYVEYIAARNHVQPSDVTRELANRIASRP